MIYMTGVSIKVVFDRVFEVIRWTGETIMMSCMPVLFYVTVVMGLLSVTHFVGIIQYILSL